MATATIASSVPPMVETASAWLEVGSSRSSSRAAASSPERAWPCKAGPGRPQPVKLAPRTTVRSAPVAANAVLCWTVAPGNDCAAPSAAAWLAGSL